MPQVPHNVQVTETLVLEVSRVLIGLALAVWIGGTFVIAVTAAKLFGALPSRAQAGDLFGQILHALDRAKFVAAGAALVGILLEVQVAGSTLPQRHVVRAVVLFLLIASHVFAVMVVQPKMRYYREKIGDLDSAAEDDPWRRKFQREHRRSSRANVFGLVLALVALMIG